MSYTLKFVESDLTTVRLDLDDQYIKHIGDKTKIPLPKHYKNWAESSQTDGRHPVGDGKYGNIPLTLSFRIAADSIANLDAKARELIAEITRDNILKYTPEGGSPLYYKTFKYDDADPGTLQRRLFRLSKFAWGFTVNLEAELPFGAEEEITIVENLVPNWQFEERTGDDFDDWVETEINGSGTATVAAETTDVVFGDTSLSCEVTATDALAYVTSENYIDVDSTKHYCFFLNCKIKQATTIPSNQEAAIFIECFDSSNVSLGTLGLGPSATMVPHDTNVWQSLCYTIYPAGTGGVDFAFYENTAKVKINLGVNSFAAGTSEMLYDGIVFTNSEYLSGHIVSNPLGLVVPAALVSGDVPAPVDIYLDKFDADVAYTYGILIGGRKNYDSGFVPYAAANVGTSSYSNLANQGDYKSIYIPGNLVLNGGFEDFTGDPTDGDFDNWTETEDINGEIEADYVSPKSGTYCLESYVNDETVTRTNEIEYTAKIAIDNTEDYIFAFWYKLIQRTGNCKLVAKIREYDATPTLLATQTITLATEKSSWTKYEYTINATGGSSPAWNANTTQIVIGFEMSGNKRYFEDYHYSYDYISLDGVEFYQSSVNLALSAAFDLDNIKGFVKPYAHLKLDAAQSGLSFDLRGKITDGTNDITDLELIDSSESQVIPASWKYMDGGLDAFEIPNARFSDNATTTDMDQEFELGISSLSTGTLYLDDLILLPIDNGYAEIAAEDDQHIIVDCQSDLPGILKSYDGTISKAARKSDASLRQIFRLNPQDGSNLAILEKSKGASEMEHAQFLMNVSLKYRPLYLLVK